MTWSTVIQILRRPRLKHIFDAAGSYREAARQRHRDETKRKAMEKRYWNVRTR